MDNITFKNRPWGSSSTLIECLNDIEVRRVKEVIWHYENEPRESTWRTANITENRFHLYKIKDSDYKSCNSIYGDLLINLAHNAHLAFELLEHAVSTLQLVGFLVTDVSLPPKRIFKGIIDFDYKSGRWSHCSAELEIEIIEIADLGCEKVYAYSIIANKISKFSLGI